MKEELDKPPTYEQSTSSQYQGSSQQNSGQSASPPILNQGYPHSHQGAQYYHQGPYHPQPNYSQPYQSPFRYPPGYICPYCRNSGVKQNQSPCGTCERQFGRQSGNVMVAHGNMAVPPGALILAPGDPRLGGRICGNCKGYGRKTYMMGMVEEMCQGTGPVFCDRYLMGSLSRCRTYNPIGNCVHGRHSVLRPPACI